jgi:hypothetical protein
VTGDANSSNDLSTSPTACSRSAGIPPSSLMATQERTDVFAVFGAAMIAPVYSAGLVSSLNAAGITGLALQMRSKALLNIEGPLPMSGRPHHFEMFPHERSSRFR